MNQVSVETYRQLSHQKIKKVETFKHESEPWGSCKKNNYTSLQTVAAIGLCQGLPAGIVVAQKSNYSL